jgi:succinoglycan biosynthesis transport protein ExoP
MTINEFLHVIWRRKLLLLTIAVIHVGSTYGALRLVTPLYESSSTLQLAPKNDRDEESSALIFFGTLEAIVPIYTEAATSRRTHEQAERETGIELPEVSVDTFEGAPLIEVKARDADAEIARQAVQAVTDVLLRHDRAGAIGLRQLRLERLDVPVRGEAPVYPKEGLTLAVALALGLALGVAAAFLREKLVTRVETAESLSRLADAPCYGEIPRESAVGRMKDLRELETKPRLRAFSEALRDLRTNLLFAEGNLHSLVITSPEGSHGKTTISFGLAISLANADTRTVLVDGDLRKGRVSELLAIHRSPGLAEAMTGTPLEDVIRHTTIDNLDAVTGGLVQGDPGELLLSEFSAILAQLEGRYEAVVIDAPPVGPVNDARIIARFATHTLIVAAADAATRRSVRTAVEQLALIDVQPTAVILNRVKRPAGKYYDGYLAPEVPRPEREQSRAGRRWRQSRVV